MNEHTLLAAIIISLAFFGESMFGFGGGLIAVPLLSILLGIKEAITLALIFQFCMGLLIWKIYKNIIWAIVLPMGSGVIAGTIVGTLALSYINPDALRLILAFSILAFLIKDWFFKGVIIANRPSIFVGNLLGLISGLLSGLIGAGGPPVTMYLEAVIKKMLYGPA